MEARETTLDEFSGVVRDVELSRSCNINALNEASKGGYFRIDFPCHMGSYPGWALRKASSKLTSLYTARRKRTIQALVTRVRQNDGSVTILISPGEYIHRKRCNLAATSAQ